MKSVAKTPPVSRWKCIIAYDGGSFNGWQNIDMAFKYLAIIDQPHEFLFTVGLDREFGGTGALRAT